MAREVRDVGASLTERPVCFCGKMGCLELYAAGPAVERDYLRRSGRVARLPEIAAARGSDVHAPLPRSTRCSRPSAAVSRR